MKRQHFLTLFFVYFVLLGSISNNFAATASFQGLGDLPGGRYYSIASDVSADGSTAVGISSSASSSNSVEAFRWTSSTAMQPLGDLPGGSFLSAASGVSADGSFIVGSSDSGSDDYREEAFLWTQSSSMVGLGFLPGGSHSSAQDISDDGSVVVGYSEWTMGETAFLWTETGGMQRIGPSNYVSYAYGVSSDGSVIVGELNGQAFRWEGGVMTGLGDLPGGDFVSMASDVSADGSVVVGYGCVGLVPQPDGSFRVELEAFRWTQSSGMVGLGDLPGGYFYSVARAVSADGSVIVGSGDTGLGGFVGEAFIWDELSGMRNLKTILENDFGLNLAGWTLYDATGISADGLTIVGHGRNPAGFQEAWIATIPEPATLLLLGLGGMAVLRKRKS